MMARLLCLLTSIAWAFHAGVEFWAHDIGGAAGSFALAVLFFCGVVSE